MSFNDWVFASNLMSLQSHHCSRTTEVAWILVGPERTRSVTTSMLKATLLSTKCNTSVRHWTVTLASSWNCGILCRRLQQRWVNGPQHNKNKREPGLQQVDEKSATATYPYPVPVSLSTFIIFMHILLLLLTTANFSFPSFLQMFCSSLLDAQTIIW